MSQSRQSDYQLILDRTHRVNHFIRLGMTSSCLVMDDRVDDEHLLLVSSNRLDALPSVTTRLGDRIVIIVRQRISK